MADDEPEEVVAAEEEPATEEVAEVEIEMSVLDALKEVRIIRRRREITACNYILSSTSFEHETSNMFHNVAIGFAKGYDPWRIKEGIARMCQGLGSPFGTIVLLGQRL